MLRLLSARTIGLAVTGDEDGSVNSAISAIKLRRAIRPSQRSVLTTHEVPALLSLSKPSDDALSRLQKALADEEDANGPTRDFLAARAQVLDIFWRQVYGVGPGRLLPRPFPWELFPSPWLRPLYTHRIVKALRAWSELTDIAHKPWPERAALAVGPVARYSVGYSVNERPDRAVSSPGMAVMWFEQAIQPDTLIHDRSSRTAVAIERYRRSHGEALPAALTDLVPTYLTEIPEDPITGQPLLYRAAADAYIVYSVGPDGKDDGGDLLRKPDPTHKGPGTIFPPSSDRGIRVLIRK
jgi:murein DD-endopeptidase MepM/ murein hydrolase activator NlpD